MHKRVILFLLISVILCGCHKSSNEGSTSSEVTDEKESYPLLFIDTANHDSQAYILCAVEDGTLCLTEDYAYSGRSLWDYLDNQDTPVSADIIDLSCKLSFVDPSGNEFQTDCDQMTCTGRVMDEAVEVLVNLTNTPPSGQLFLGTYSGINLIAQDVVRGEKSMTADLNADGIQDTISWSFTPADPDTYGDHAFYEITVTVNGETYFIDGSDGLPCKESDLSVFAADIDQDSIMELVVYVKGMSRFGHVEIYRLCTNGPERILYYTIDPEP